MIHLASADSYFIMSAIIVFNHVWNPENPQWASPPNWIANSSKKETYGSPWSSLTAVHSTSLPGKVSQKHSSICINDEHRKRMMLSCHRHDMSEYFPMNQLKIARQIFKSLFYCWSWQMQRGTRQLWWQPSLPWTSGDRNKLVAHMKRLRKA